MKYKINNSIRVGRRVECGKFGRPFRRVSCLVIFAGLLIFSGRLRSTEPGPLHNASEQQMRECSSAAKNALGDHADVLMCGDLNSPGVLEVVAAIRKHATENESGNIFISRLVILRRENSTWNTALDVAKEIRNSRGYVGGDVIDGASPYWGYSVEFHDRRADGVKSFVISLAYMATRNDMDELPFDISWDPTVGRYREFIENSEPVGFRPELSIPRDHKK